MSPEKNVVGIDFVTGRDVIARKPVRSRQHQRANQFLDRPAVAHELQSELIEQFGMTRLLTEFAEVIDAGDEAAAEKMLPDAIGGDSRSQRVVR